MGPADPQSPGHRQGRWCLHEHRAAHVDVARELQKRAHVEGDVVAALGRRRAGGANDARDVDHASLHGERRAAFEPARPPSHRDVAARRLDARRRGRGRIAIRDACGVVLALRGVAADRAVDQDVVPRDEGHPGIGIRCREDRGVADEEVGLARRGIGTGRQRDGVAGKQDAGHVEHARGLEHDRVGRPQAALHGEIAGGGVHRDVAADAASGQAAEHDAGGAGVEDDRAVDRLEQARFGQLDGRALGLAAGRRAQAVEEDVAVALDASAHLQVAAQRRRDRDRRIDSWRLDVVGREVERAEEGHGLRTRDADRAVGTLRPQESRARDDDALPGGRVARVDRIGTANHGDALAGGHFAADTDLMGRLDPQAGRAVEQRHDAGHDLAAAGDRAADLGILVARDRDRAVGIVRGENAIGMDLHAVATRMRAAVDGDAPAGTDRAAGGDRIAVDVDRVAADERPARRRDLHVGGQVTGPVVASLAGRLDDRGPGDDRSHHFQVAGRVDRDQSGRGRIARQAGRVDAAGGRQQNAHAVVVGTGRAAGDRHGAGRL